MGKSVKHKGENTFRFQTFSERIANINIDVIHQIKQQEETPGETGTYFYQALENWVELNCTKHFTDFYHQVHDKVQTFPQLVHHEDFLVESLQIHLQIQDCQALEPLLDLVVQLARDLQSDFYVHFYQFFDILVRLLNSHPQDTELLEKIFTCLSYLVKFLWRYMLRDIQDVYRKMSALLDSQYKEYIRNFAAESFAFLMRKAKEPSQLFDFMLLELSKEPDKCEGSGRLMFEMIKGVKNQFHSCSSKILPMLLQKLCISLDRQLETLKLDVVERVLGSMIQSMAHHSNKEHMIPMWQCILDSLNSFHSSWQELKTPEEKASSAEALERLLRLTNFWITYKRGLVLSQPDSLAKLFIGFLKGPQLPDKMVEELLIDVSSLLLTAHVQLSVENTAKLTSLVYKSNFPLEAVSKFTASLFDLPLFEKDVLPWLLKFCQNGVHGDEGEQQVLLLLTQLVLTKCPMPPAVDPLDNLQCYLLDFGEKSKQGFPKFVLSQLDVDHDSLNSMESSLKIWSSLVCLPHVRPLTVSNASKKVLSVMQNIKLKLEKVDKSDPETERLLFIMYQCVHCLTLLKQDKLLKWIALEQILDVVNHFCDKPAVLHLANLYFTTARQEGAIDVLSQEVLLKIFPAVKQNLCSPSSQVRLLTLHILSQFEMILPNCDQDAEIPMDIFRICLEVEKIEPVLNTYRERLLHLRKLEYNTVQKYLPIGPFQQVPLQVLIGNLFVSFKLLWEPTRELIASHAKGLSKALFWEVFSPQLQLASQCAEKSTHMQKMEQQLSGDGVEDKGGLRNQVETTITSVFTLLLRKTSEEERAPDFLNFRNQLWSSMQLFPEHCQSSSKEFVPLFFQFLRNEYYKSDSNDAPSQSLVLPSSTTLSSVQTPVIDVEEEEEMEDQEGETLEKAQVEKTLTETRAQNPVTKHRKSAIKSLVVQLEVFSRIKNPTALHLEPKLRALYRELLKHRDPEVQRVAFNCIMTYKDKHLTPYKDNFERLMDDKSFKTELVLFSIDHENSPIAKDDRIEVLQILMSILYGKMQGKMGLGTSGRSNIGQRQSLVFRFLNGCSHQELACFMELVFAPFRHFISDNPLKMVLNTRKELDLENTLPPKKMFGALSTMDTIFKKLGHLSDSFLPSLYQIILGISTCCAECLENRDKLVPSVIPILKNVRQLALTRLKEFFEYFDDFQYTAVDIDAMFEAAVWPQLSKISLDGIYTPTPLLKLLHIWAKLPRYTALLAKHPEGAPKLTPLNSVFQLLLAPKVSSAVSSFILEIVDTLLSGNEAQEGFVRLADINNITDIDLKAPDLGIHLLKPYISDILKFFQSNIASIKDKLGKKQEAFKELDILSKLSVYVESEEDSTVLVKSLLPFLDPGVKRSEKTELNLLTIVMNLMKQIESRHKFYRFVVPLFLCLSRKQSRDILCSIFQIVCEQEKDMQAVAVTVAKMNSWDKRRVEDPDYTTRLKEFQQINSLLRESTVINPTFCLPILYNCCFFINTIEDLSLRDSSTHCLVTMVKQFEHAQYDQDVFREIISQGLLNVVKAGLRNKNETVRHEYIGLLSTLADIFSDHATFLDLHALKDKDVETDFFENIKHIQLHRRAKALRKLRNHLSKCQVRNETLISYFLPIASSFVNSEIYNKANALQDAAVEAMGAICRQLKWHNYLQQLKHYLQVLAKSLDTQKLTVRLIVTILDAFHFDLSNSQQKDKGPPMTFTSEPQINNIEEDNEKEKEEKDDEDVTMDTVEDTTSVHDISKDAVELTQGKQLCPSGLATRIHGTILSSILPDLHKTLVQKARSDGEHKLTKSKYAEDDEILRVPLAIAMVKLLQNLPQKQLEQHLPGILIKVCNFLKSRSNDIRNTARDTLVKILQSLGHRFFPFILMELRGTLKRGYQLHVLCFTLHLLLKHIATSINAGDLDICLKGLQEVFNEEIFGEVAEEKEVEGITGKLFEAKSSKSYDSYEILSSIVGPGSLTVLISPLKQILETTHSHKMSRKVQDVLKRIAYGLMENKAITTEMLMIYIHSLTVEVMPLLDENKVEKAQEQEPTKPGQKPASCLLLTTVTPRGGAKPKSNKKTNLHVVVEFGLLLLHQCLKKQKLNSSDVDHLRLIDPLVETLAQCLFSKHIKVNSGSLRCLIWLLRFRLPSIKTNIKKIANGMFVLLKNHGSVGSAKGDNHELALMCFKAVTVLVRHVEFFKISTEQLQVLLLFCEEDLHDYNRQSTAFSLLKAILSRKLSVPEMEDLMKKIQETSITADSPHVRRECRQVMQQYMLDYPLGKKLQKHLEFYVTQLSYETEAGRESTLELLATVFTTFPQQTLTEYASFFYLPMSASLANDESVKCRKLIALAIKSLLGKLDHTKRNELYTITMKWFSDSKVLLRTMAAQLVGLFVEVEASNFEHHLSTLLPVLEQQIEPGKWEKEERQGETQSQDMDHLLYNSLNTLNKVLRECGTVLHSDKWRQNMNIIFDHVQIHLRHPHVWVQLAAAQLFGMLFASYKPEDLARKPVNLSGDTIHGYLETNTTTKLRSLALSFFSHLQSPFLNEELACQVVKNMVFISKVAMLMKHKTSEEGDQTADKSTQLTVEWLVKKMIREVYHEAIHNPGNSIKRSNVFKWLAAVSLNLESELLISILPIVMPSLQKELSEQSSTQDASLRQLAGEVMELLKKLVGVEDFTRVYAAAQKIRAEKRETRKQQRAVKAVSDPEFAAKRKIKKNLAKQATKKRRIDELRPSRKARKRKYEQVTAD
ncbi:hypothetical protein CHS0354_025985 [Potamilus streckersoni]|uniref:Small subunit processome component 20 homolog n=1 Tax=Potamilus streckersoni TaxID=2493646 RepID=A0AAE0W6Z7_9BIVA|nr:hypothetical protein CHS0354_025985 [Potamilus streckersoni]